MDYSKYVNQLDFADPGFRQEESRLEKLFFEDLVREHNIDPGHPKLQLLISLAWEFGHSSGLRSVAECFAMFSGLLA